MTTARRGRAAGLAPVLSSSMQLLVCAYRTRRGMWENRSQFLRRKPVDFAAAGRKYSRSPFTPGLPSCKETVLVTGPRADAPGVDGAERRPRWLVQ